MVLSLSLNVVHRRDRGLRFGVIREADKAESPAAASVSIFNDHLYSVRDGRAKMASQG